MADYPIPNLDESTRRVTDLYGSVFPELDTGTETIAYRDARVLAGAIADGHAHMEAVDRDAIPVTAEGEALERWGSFRGVTRKGATTAVGVDGLAVTGLAGSSVTVGLVLQDSVTGIQVETTTADTLDIDGNGLVSVETVETEDSDGNPLGVGSRANLPAGTVLTFLSPPAGVDDDANLVKALTGGEDEETDGAFRGRVVNRFAQPPQGGNTNDFAQWIVLVDGIDSGHPLPRRNGIGTVDLVGLRNGQGAERIPSGAQEAEIATTVAALQPLGVESRVVTPVAEVVDVNIELTVFNRPEYAFDWDDATALEVLTYDSGTRIVETTAALPDDFGPGDRIVFEGDGRVFLVGSIVSTTEFTLTSDNAEDLTFAPAVGTEIYAGSPVTAAVREAVLNGYDAPDGSRIPGINNLGPANEEDRYGGGWVDTVEEGRLVSAAQSVAGVYRAEISGLEVDDVAVVGGIARPTDPAVPGALPEETLTTGLLVAGAIVVRRSRL